jgi:plasmid stabilization system protein ParE
VTRRVIFTPLAGAEFADAVAWYEARSWRTSNRFIAGVMRLRDRIADNPLQYATLQDDARRAVVHGFPYVLIYRVSGDEVQVLGCFHTSRNPRAWRRRLR